MTPLVFLNGVLLGTFASIGFGLTVVMLLFALLGASEPQVSTEWPSLVRYTLASMVMTALFAFSFIGHLRRRSWRWSAQGVALAGLLVAGWLSFASG